MEEPIFSHLVQLWKNVLVIFWSLHAMHKGVWLWHQGKAVSPRFLPSGWRLRSRCDSSAPRGDLAAWVCRGGRWVLLPRV